MWLQRCIHFRYNAGQKPSPSYLLHSPRHSSHTISYCAARITVMDKNVYVKISTAREVSVIVTKEREEQELGRNKCYCRPRFYLCDLWDYLHVLRFRFMDATLVTRLASDWFLHSFLQKCGISLNWNIGFRTILVFSLFPHHVIRSLCHGFVLAPFSYTSVLFLDTHPSYPPASCSKCPSLSKPAPDPTHDLHLSVTSPLR